MNVKSPMVSMAQLLSTCLDANRQGCQVIREYWQQNAVTETAVLKEAHEVKSVVTQADVDAQKTIVGGLQQTWGSNLNIIGEEDDQATEITESRSSLQMNLLRDIVIQDVDIPIEELTIFVDPLDGTREFVEGRIENVACLIGIARNGRALGGVIGLPFSKGEKQSVVVHYAFLQANDDFVHGIWPPLSHKDDKETESHSATVLTGDSSNPTLVQATKYAMALATKTHGITTKHCILGGTAAKLVQVAFSSKTIAILHFKTSLWDTCATEALIHAKGGHVTDLFGSPLLHYPKSQTGNVLGVVSSSAGMKQVHDDLCIAMRANVEATRAIFGKYMGTYHGGEEINCSQALDVARDENGAPLELQWLKEQILGSASDKEGVSLRGYAVPESEATRGSMLSTCRIYLDWEEIKGEIQLPKGVLYKRYMSDQPDIRIEIM